MILQKFELCKVQLTHGANQLYIHGNEKLNCLGSTGTSRSQIKSFTVCFLYDSISTPGLVQELADDVCSITTHLSMVVVHLPSLLHTETLQLSAGEVCVLNYIPSTAARAYNCYWRKGSKR